MLEALFETVPNDPFNLNWTGVANVISFLQADRFFVEVVFAFSPQAEQAGRTYTSTSCCSEMVEGTIAGLRFTTALSFPVHHLEKRPTG